MPVMDYIRARVRQPDCLWAVFPDNHGSVFSPMNDQVFPIPGSATSGSTDVNDRLLTLTKFRTNDVFDHQVSFNTGADRISPGDDAYIASNLDIRGMTLQITRSLCVWVVYHAICSQVLLYLDSLPIDHMWIVLI